MEQAIGWRVRLASGLAAADEVDACLRWRASDPAHDQAWQRLAFFDGRLAGIAPSLASSSLRRAAIDPARRRTLKSLLLLAGTAAVVGGGSLGLRDSPWLAQQRTLVGERRRIALPDGGWLQLNTDSAVDVAYDPEQRRVRLYRGEMLVQTAPDSARRTFWVETPLGRL